jgi:putative tryptophan/tyrosine transport system substrate-binding protein
MTPDMRRRKCIGVLGTALGTTLVWPLLVRAQSAERVRRIGVLIYGDEDSRGSQAQAAGLRQGLKDLGWTEGRNVRIDVRFDGDPGRIRTHAEELVKSTPDVIVVRSVLAARALQQQTHTIPIVFAGVGDPVLNGLVTSLAHPEGNITGVTNLFYSIGGKWLELLKEASPQVTRVAIIFTPEIGTSEGWFAAIEAAAAMLGVTAARVPVRNAAEIAHALGAFASEPNGGLIVVPPGLVGADREALLAEVAQRRLPAVYDARSYTAEGGLMSYGADSADMFRQSATHVDRILRGAKPGDLPVQNPDKFELSINLKTAKAMGLDIPEMLIARADEVIE